MDPLRFRMPLAHAVLDDPAFSSDPRSHPHFPLANARSYRALPPKSPPRSARSSSSSPESDSLASSSATSHAQSPSHTRASTVPSLSPVPPSSTNPNLFPKPHRPRHPLLVPDILPKLDTTQSVLKPIPTNIPRKTRMRAFVRRLTTRHNLDRIDELDETDPFGASHHHDGPYEAIVSNLAQPTHPHMYSHPAPSKGNIHHPKRQSDPHPLRPSQHQSASRVPSVYRETGLSLHLKPGQILQPNTIYSSHARSVVAVPGQFLPYPNTVSTTTNTRPDPSRRQSLPNPRTRPHQDLSTSDPWDGLRNRSSSLRAPHERYLRDHTLDVPNGLPVHLDHSTTPHALHQTEKIVFPPPRYESRSHGEGLLPSPKRSPPPSYNPMSPKTWSIENAAPALHRHDSQHKNLHSLDSSHTINSTLTRPSSSTENWPLDLTQIRHFPKRLVMPAPLQPQPQQSQHKSPPAELSVWQDDYPDDYVLEDEHFEGKSVMYSQTQRLLRKKSAFPTKTPIPDHTPTSQDDAMGNSSTKTVNEAQGTIEGTIERPRRRRLSKRKNDI